ncbi:hypothetical protein D9M68_227880 [compost metagenome]
MHHAAVLALAAVAHRVPGLAADDRLELGAGAVAVFGQDEVGIGSADQFVGAIAEHAVAGGADLDEALVRVDGAEYVHGVIHDPLVLCLQPGLVLQALLQFEVAFVQSPAALDGQAREALADHQQEGEAEPEEHEQRWQVDGGVVSARQRLVGAHLPAPFRAEFAALLTHREAAVPFDAAAGLINALRPFEDFQDEAVQVPAELTVQGGADIQAGHQQHAALPVDAQRRGHQGADIVDAEALRRAHSRLAALANLLQPVAQLRLGQETLQPAVGLATAGALADRLEVGVQHGDQVEVGEVAQVAVDLL